jgi:DNA-binding beta-propeller fold protein YncE
MKRSSIAAFVVFSGLVCAAAGCGGRNQFTPQSPAESYQSDGRASQLAPGLAPLPNATASHGVFYVVNDSGQAPFFLFGFSQYASGDEAPAALLGGQKAAFDYPQGVALSHEGYAYVAGSNPNSSSAPYEIEEFAPPLTGDKAPVATIVGDKTQLEGTALAITEQGTLYVANEYVSGSGYISIFAPGATGNVEPYGTIYGSKTELAQPVAVALGATGKIYVANLGDTSSPTVTVYATNAKGNVAPLERFAAPQNPTAIAVDKSGTVYVASSYAGGVYVYAAGATSPKAEIGGSLLGTKYQLEPFALAVDENGNLYVSNDAPTAYSSAASQVLVYAPGAGNSTKPVAVIAGGKTGLSDAKGIAVPPFASAPTPAPTAKPTASPTPKPTPKPTATPTEPPAADEGVYVADTSSKTLLGFTDGTSGSSTPLVDIAGSSTYLDQATSAFADAKGNMWVAEQVDSTGSSAVLEWKAGSNGNAVPTRRIYGQGPNGASDVVVDSAGNIYVLETNESQIAVFAPTANGTATPVRTFTASIFNGPVSFALDPAEKNLYVTNTDQSGTPEILIFPVTSKGTVTPKEITSSNDAPASSYMFSGISLDRSGNVFVGASPEGSYDGEIFEFPAGKTGNVTPIRAIDDAYGSTQPTGVGVDAAGNVYVANFPDLFGGTAEAILVYKPGSSSIVRKIPSSALKIPGVLRVGPYVK